MQAGASEVGLRGGIMSDQDANNNDGHMRKARASFESSPGNNSDWHLLDVDGNSISASTSTTSSSSELESFEQERSREKRRVIKRRRACLQDGNYSTDENSMEQQCQLASCHGHRTTRALSPLLIHMCTALYALMPLASLLVFLILIALLFTRLWFITAIYYSYLIYDSKTCNRGGRRIESLHRAKFWSYLAAYFPIKLQHSRQFKLDPNENYILNYHPHGISAFGCVGAFATNGLNFCERFPGITSRFMVHETSFLVPLMREIFSFRGDCSVNSSSFDFILAQKWSSTPTANAPDTTTKGRASGNLLALCGGGLAEADLSQAECLRIVAATRKGFVKKALTHGAHLIPCIAFGENSVFTKIHFAPGSLLHSLETRFYQMFKFKHPIYYGHSILVGSKGHGSMPYRRPITVVMGDPIPVERVERPSQEQVDQLHASYLKQLQAIYDANQDLCSIYDKRLELV